MAYNKNKLFIWGAIICLWSLVNLIYVNLTVTSEIDKHMFPRCQTMITYPALVSMATLDTIAGTINLILFIRPIMMLYSLINREDKTLENTTKKQSILSIIAISSTIISLICMGLIGAQQIFISIDIVISLLAVILMYQWNKAITQKLFCCCLYSEQTLKQTKLHIDNITQSVNDSVVRTTSTVSSTRGHRVRTISDATCNNSSAAHSVVNPTPTPTTDIEIVLH